MARTNARAEWRIHEGIPHRRLYARAGGEIVGALEFSVTESAVDIQVIFVKPPFRSQGIAASMIDSLRARYPGKQICHAAAHCPGVKP